jgi:hypothetical protein
MARRKADKARRLAEEPPPVSPEARGDLRALILSTPVEPELMAEVIQRLQRAGRRGAAPACVGAYFDFYGLDPKRNTEPEDLLVLSALTARVAALTGILETMAPPEPSNQRQYWAVIEAASTVRLIEQDGGPAFQLFEFLAAVDRLEAEIA